MSISINKLTNANVYVDGNSFIGRAEEINLPVIKQKMADHKALGLIGELEFWAGGVEKMEAKIKWNSFYRDAFLKNGNPTVAVKLQCRGSLQTHTSDGLSGSVPYVCYLTALFKDFPLGNFKQLDNAEFETNLAVYYAKLEVDGEELFQIDVPANIYKIGGTDILAKYRLDIGA